MLQFLERMAQKLDVQGRDADCDSFLIPPPDLGKDRAQSEQVIGKEEGVIVVEEAMREGMNERLRTRVPP